MEDPVKKEFSTRVSVLIGIGSNLGDRTALIEEAIRKMDGLSSTSVIRRSSTFETEPVGGPAGQDLYLNLAVELETSLPPLELLDQLQEIESALGRVRTVKNGPRTIDLDILLYGSDIIDLPRLTVPHPRLHERMFVLSPLAELAPDRVHPQLSKTVRELIDLAERR